ncbi:MAG: type IV secretion system protein VirB10 [Bosea sp. (in: a-proteobacteria)]
MPTPEQWRQLDLDAAATSAVARSQSQVGTFLKVIVPLGAVLLAGYIIYAGTRDPRPSFIRPDNEEFRTTQFPAPSLGEPPPQRNQGTIVIPPAPPPLPPEMPPAPIAPPAMLSPPPPPPEPPAPILAQPGLRNVPPADDSEARRLAEEERRRWERFRASSIVVDQGGEVALGADGTRIPGPGGDQIPRDQETDPNRRFLNQTAAAGVETAQASQNRRIDALVPQGTMIRAVLENAVVSDLPGMVRAVTTEDIWSFDGRRILIPSGSRLIGDYRSAIARGQTRVFVIWTRMLRSDGVSVQLGSIGTDDLGRTGNSGYVDNKYLERFGAAIVLSVVGAASQFIAGLGVRDTSTTNGPTITVTDPVTGISTTTQPGGNSSSGLSQSDRARQIAAQTTSQTLTQLAQEALRDSINIPPTIYLDQGTRVIVFVRRDLDFSALYPDPVREALREIQRERQRAP